MEVRFREIDPFNCWIWLRFSDVPSEGERSYLDGVFDSWYVIGRLGGFNAENLQAHEAGSDLSWMNYETQEAINVMPALMHNLGHLEYQGEWARCWVDLGTCDAIAIDVLINMFLQITGDVVEVNQMLIGGSNDDWPVEEHPDAIFTSDN
ncbi:MULTISPECIES: DUF3531 family protein [Prochlorococcus]|uniref:DUF3531 family protein n=1 Tax=Prochlorococcus TaxID=1218 RepID=UPI0005625E9C|nr:MULTISPECIES: DUF3531 family protein [Prochlorococcus]